jgi:hypothetical protein
LLDQAAPQPALSHRSHDIELGGGKRCEVGTQDARLAENELQSLRSGVGFELLEPFGREAQSACVILGVGKDALGHVGKPERSPKRIPHLAVDACNLADLGWAEGRRLEPDQAADWVVFTHA